MFLQLNFFAMLDFWHFKFFALQVLFAAQFPFEVDTILFTFAGQSDEVLALQDAALAKFGSASIAVTIIIDNNFFMIVSLPFCYHYN